MGEIEIIEMLKTKKFPPCTYFLAGGWLANPAGLSRQTKEKFTSLINPLHWDPLLLRFAMQFCNKINELIMCTTTYLYGSFKCPWLL